MEKLIPPPAVMPALDMASLEKAKILATRLANVSKMIAGFKIGSLLVMENGLPEVCRELGTTIPLILDMQKHGTDVPSVVEEQIEIVARHGIKFCIGAPLGAGSCLPESREGTLETFVSACQKNKIHPVILLEMTQPGANRFLANGACEDLARLVCDLEVSYVVAPANKPDRIKMYRSIFLSKGAQIQIISPGVGPQKTGNAVDDAASAVSAGADYLVVGRAIYAADDPRDAVLKISNAITSAARIR
jgi:orotidine-5'-phosphate decarboxylase